MAAALPFVSAGLGLYSAIKGGQAQDQAQGMTQQELEQQQQIRNMVLSRLNSGPTGNPQNPFSGQYGKISAPVDPQAAVNAKLAQVGIFR